MIELNDELIADKNFIMVAVTGGPAAGKSDFVRRVFDILSPERDVTVDTLDETVTELVVQEGIKPGDLTPEEFQRLVISTQLRRERSAYQDLLREAGSKGYTRALICDRGVIDSKAYIDSDTFKRIVMDLPGVVKEHDLLSRYDAVVHMVTAANGAEEHYTTENNPARTETPKEARRIDEKTKQVWKNHRNHLVVDNSTSFEEKLQRATKALKRVIPLPLPEEKEHKYLVTDPSVLDELPLEDLPSFAMEQCYLEVSDTREERVRERKNQATGDTGYTRTVKTPTGRPGVRNDPDEKISREEYEHARDNLMVKNSEPIRKVRYYLHENGHRFEIDVLQHPVERSYVEVEVADMDTPVDLPAVFSGAVRDVTGEDEHSMASIALGG